MQRKQSPKRNLYCPGVIASLTVVMNAPRGGAFLDESFGSARAKAFRVFEEVYGPLSDELHCCTESLNSPQHIGW